jgi:CRP-like cAMP-binding protein
MVSKYSEIFFSRFGGPILAERLTSGLDAAERQCLGAIMHKRNFECGDTIFSRNIIPTEILVLTRGTAELESGVANGKTRVVRPGEVLGLTETLAEAKYYDTLIAITDCEANVISRGDLIGYLRRTPEACFRSLEVVAENLHEARERVLGDH